MNDRIAGGDSQLNQSFYLLGVGKLISSDIWANLC